MPQSLVHNVLHLVFSTKERQPCISKQIRDDLNAYIVGILRKNECHSIIAGSEKDHVHVLFILSKNKALKDVVREAKAGSSRWLKGKGEDFKDFQWQGGYSAFSVSQSNVAAVIRYIRGQEEHHRKFSFKEELMKLLEKHGVQFDERYLWD